MSIAAEASRLELDVEKQCNLILNTDAEFWDVRNKAMLTLTDLVAKYDGHPSACDIIGMNVFRLLKEPIKSMISDLRSQQVRDTCLFLTKLSQCVGDHLRHLLRDLFPSILDGVKVCERCACRLSGVGRPVVLTFPRALCLACLTTPYPKRPDPPNLTFPHAHERHS